MAIISSLAVGKSRKSAGNLTYQHYYGKVVAKQKVLSNPKYVPSSAQVSQRKQQGYVGASTKAIMSYLQTAFVRSKNGSFLNNFIKSNKDYLYSDIMSALTTISAWHTWITAEAAANKPIVTSKGINAIVSVVVGNAGIATVSFQDNKSYKSVSLFIVAQSTTGGTLFAGSLPLEYDSDTQVWKVTAKDFTAAIGVTAAGGYAMMACVVADNKPVSMNNGAFNFTKA